MFSRTPDGSKTALMRKVEARIGRSLEDDYHEYYLVKGWGQKRLADRWGVRRATIFEPRARTRGRSWVQMLQLTTRPSAEPTRVLETKRHACEVCGDSSVPLERAHWVPASDGGVSASDNILALCPNCHTKLDQVHDPATTARARAVLLHRTARRVLALNGHTAEQFMTTCERIIAARK